MVSMKNKKYQCGEKLKIHSLTQISNICQISLMMYQYDNYIISH